MKSKKLKLSYGKGQILVGHGIVLSDQTITEIRCLWAAVDEVTKDPGRSGVFSFSHQGAPSLQGVCTTDNTDDNVMEIIQAIVNMKGEV